MVRRTHRPIDLKRPKSKNRAAYKRFWFICNSAKLQYMETMSFLSKTPPPPYYAVIFTSEHSDDLNGYSITSSRMEELAKKQDGYLGIESVRKGERGITVSYWISTEAIKKWKANLEHLEAQAQGKEKWYSNYKVRIAKVERDYE